MVKSGGCWGDNAKWCDWCKTEGVILLYLIDGDANGLNRNAYRLVDGRGAADLQLLDVPVSGLSNAYWLRGNVVFGD